MARILYAGTFGSDDPTRASMPFVFAGGAIDAGHEPAGVVLLGEATYLAKRGVAEAVRGVGFSPLTEVLAKLMEHRVPVYV